ncbi:MAG: carbon monoxide dehydrogenase subunit G [Rhodobacteraceae bacterium]|nr:carbon monoxide dehydrogenase subunit G [Paracoccaceae bacterium]
MELSDEIRIQAPRERVYEALNDPEVLRQCIPGCESLEKKSDTELDATVVLKVGPVKARFTGAVRLENLNPPIGYTLVGEGSGGVAGFAKGSGDVELIDEGGETLMKYDVKADIGGKLAQLGSRLIAGTAKRLAGQFFEKFAEVVGTPPEEGSSTA